MPDSFHTALASREDLMRFHDPVRIQGYCASCENFGRFWSCPPFMESPLLRFPAWEHAVVVCGKVRPEPGASKEQMLAQFFAARKIFRDVLVGVEQRHQHVTALVAGFCTGCETCPRPLGQSCCAPAALRYSLEAVGFDVSGVVENLAGQKLHWPKTGAPEYLMTVGAFLCPNRNVAEALIRAVKNE